MRTPIKKEINTGQCVIRYKLFAGENAGNSVLLVHPFLCTSKLFDSVVEIFPDSVNVIAPDLPGWGKSDTLDDYSFSSISKELQVFIKEIQRQHSELSVIAFSFGASLITKILGSNEELDLKHIIFVEPLFTLENFKKLKLRQRVEKVLFITESIKLRPFLQKIWKKKTLVYYFIKLIFLISSPHEVARPKHQIMDIINCDYDAFWGYMKTVFGISSSDYQMTKSNFPVIIYYSPTDELDSKFTIEGYQKTFKNLTLREISLKNHYPVERIDAKFVNKYFGSQVKEIINIVSE